MSTQVSPAIGAMEQIEQMHISGPKLTIASLYPCEIRYPDRPFKSELNTGYVTNYKIEAAPFDGPPTTTRIGGGMERIYFGNNQYGPRPESAIVIARDFVRFATRVPDATRAAGPAIWICAGDAPSKEEEVRYRAGQTRWARLRITKCDDWFLNGGREKIGELERTMAQWMRVDPRAHPWVKLQERIQTKKCQFCRAEIDFDASVCSECTRIVDRKLFDFQERLRDGVAQELETLAAEYRAEGIELGPDSVPIESAEPVAEAPVPKADTRFKPKPKPEAGA
jgi:hypothetical protein